MTPVLGRSARGFQSSPARHLNESKRATVRVDTSGLLDLGLLQGDLKMIGQMRTTTLLQCTAPVTGGHGRHLRMGDYWGPGSRMMGEAGCRAP